MSTERKLKYEDVNAGSFLQIEPKYFGRIKMIRPAINGLKPYIRPIREISEQKKGV